MKLPAEKIYTGNRTSALQALRLNMAARFDKQKSERAPIFIIGTGRSGTHWLGWIMERSDELKVLIEQAPLFEWVLRAAMDPANDGHLYDNVAARYRGESAMAGSLRLVDKSHPNIWLADQLAADFPKAQFIAITRDVFGTTASMLQHIGVRHWIEEWDRYPVPNRFLGITDENKAWYASLSLAERAAQRWLVHLKQMKRLEAQLGDKLLHLSYANLFQSPDEHAAEIAQFLNLKHPLQTPEVKSGSLEKWKDELSEEQINAIKAIVGEHADVR